MTMHNLLRATIDYLKESEVRQRCWRYDLIKNEILIYDEICTTLKVNITLSIDLKLPITRI
jgi:hypothetical protein